MISSAIPVDADLRVEVRDRHYASVIALHGEASLTNAAQLRPALDGIRLDGTESVHLHLSDLDFADVAGLRELVSFATRLKETGRTVMTCNAQPILHQMARLLDTHDDLGL